MDVAVKVQQCYFDGARWMVSVAPASAQRRMGLDYCWDYSAGDPVGFDSSDAALAHAQDFCAALGLTIVRQTAVESGSVHEMGPAAFDVAELVCWSEGQDRAYRLVSSMGGMMVQMKFPTSAEWQFDHRLTETEARILRAWHSRREVSVG